MQQEKGIQCEIPRTNDFEKGFPIHYSEIDGKTENYPLIKDDQASGRK
jgi:7,8-dihydropterin-6-yl-methyl-4-(beta-D-ribofuranosyl)aminobenzene 5'-phosphate synthase